MSDYPDVSQDGMYEAAAAQFGPALERLARAWEADKDKRRDLLQEIHFAVWRSFAVWDGRCSLRTWVYRVAHNTTASHVIRQRRIHERLIAIEDIDTLPGEPESGHTEVLVHLIRTLKPLDRQVIVLYLEGMDAAETGEITGLSPGSVAMKIHRIKAALARRFQSGAKHG